MITLTDGLNKRDAERFKRSVLAEDAKLRKFGSTGNYINVRVEESFRRGHTLDPREDVVSYRVVADKAEAQP